MHIKQGLICSVLLCSGLLLTGCTHAKQTYSTTPTVTVNKSIQQPKQNVLHESELQLNNIEQHWANQRKQYHYPQVAHNTRDLGGYPTSNGKYVTKPDKLIRSNELSHLSKHGAMFLQNKLHVHQIIDLRDRNEIEHHPDPDEMVPHQAVVTHHVHFKFNVPENQDQVYTDKQSHQVRNHNALYSYHHYYSLTPQAEHAYSRAIKQIAQPHQGAILYHCIAGKDRTGILSSLLLSALGVNRQVIYRDYLLTDYYHPKVTYRTQLHDLEGFFNITNKKYGNTINYLHHLGITNSNIQSLKKQYLEPASKLKHNNTQKHLHQVHHHHQHHSHHYFFE